ncbi:unnamed protein product [Caenorhabditis sp. 36 PRJEB53466]|nr:unnamed protein product [Caenorhabditis sp. 36 PRJEB53466]
MRVLTKLTEEEVRKELFGPIQEAARQPYQLNVDPRKSWCELSEMRLSTLICQFKPVGINRHFHLMAIVDHMARIYDNEHAQSEVFLTDEDQCRFRNQQRDMLMGACPDAKDRVAFAPKYMCRPSLEVVEQKIRDWFGMEYCEENECYPNSFGTCVDYELPDYIKNDTDGDLRDSPVVAPTSSKRRRIPTPED